MLNFPQKVGDGGLFHVHQLWAALRKTAFNISECNFSDGSAKVAGGGLGQMKGVEGPIWRGSNLERTISNSEVSSKLWFLFIWFFSTPNPIPSSNLKFFASDGLEPNSPYVLPYRSVLGPC